VAAADCQVLSVWRQGVLFTVPAMCLCGCRGSLQVGDLLSDLAAAPMEVEVNGADGWVHQVCPSATACAAA
jgi:hypothetical protein